MTHPACQVCGRRLLPGERPTSYLTRDGSDAVVCELCKPRAEAAGWLRPEEADSHRAAGGAPDRRRPRGSMLGGILARRPAVPGGEDRADVVSSPAAPTGRPPSTPPGDETAGTTIPAALVAFNFSDHRRTVAGLSRTLGPPRASALAISAASGDPAVRLTVAWELTWYQWEVSQGSRGPEVRESGKGETIDQLRAPDRTWNLMVDSDGTLQQRAAA